MKYGIGNQARSLNGADDESVEIAAITQKGSRKVVMFKVKGESVCAVYVCTPNN